MATNRTRWMLSALVIGGISMAARAQAPWPGATWARATPAEAGMDAGTLDQARKYALTGGGSGCVTRGGRLVLQWGDPTRRYDLKSTTKSIGMTAVGLALKDGKIASLSDPARKYHPSFGTPPAENARTGWIEKITLEHLARQTAGFGKSGGYTKLEFAPGTRWQYSDGGPNWLAECVTLAYKKDLNTLMFERVFGPLGIRPGDLTWRRNSYRAKEIAGVARREFGSGISANVAAMARIGYLYLRRGRWRDRQILTGKFIDLVTRTPPGGAAIPVTQPKVYGKASAHYGLLWWNNNDGRLASVPRDAYWSWGLYDSLIVVIPSLDIVASRAGKSWKRTGGQPYDVLKGFLGPIAASVRAPGSRPGAAPGGGPDRTKAPASTGAYPPSPVITDLAWAPAKSIVRLARGSDNWPITWGDDGDLYTAYGDGWGFPPRVPKKLSLGLARVTGMPPKIRGANLRSPTAEQYGDGRGGRKASGMLMVDGVLYLAARNADRKGHGSTLAWSKDRGKTWTWGEWRFSELGYPTLLNFGPNYAGARDDYVYLYSPDTPDAYQPADRMILARAPKTRLAERKAWQFFAGTDGRGGATWTADLAGRAAVFTNPGRCFRSGISYCAPLRRYLWCQITRPGSSRQGGGIGIYDAPEPWGPWTTVYLAERWDVSPGETASFPPKWMSPDGRAAHLVFSGDDSFSVRRVRLTVRPGRAH